MPTTQTLLLLVSLQLLPCEWLPQTIPLDNIDWSFESSAAALIIKDVIQLETASADASTNFDSYRLLFSSLDNIKDTFADEHPNSDSLHPPTLDHAGGRSSDHRRMSTRPVPRHRQILQLQNSQQLAQGLEFGLRSFAESTTTKTTTTSIIILSVIFITLQAVVHANPRGADCSRSLIFGTAREIEMRLLIRLLARERTLRARNIQHLSYLGFCNILLNRHRLCEI